jgi:hypothetical protein
MTYTYLTFQSPSLITEDEFGAIKCEIELDPDFKITPKIKPPFEFMQMLKYFGVCTGGSFLLFTLGSFLEGTWLAIVFFLPGAFAFFCAVMIPLLTILHGLPNYIMYKIDEKKYYAHLKTVIRRSENYEEFKRKCSP